MSHESDPVSYLAALKRAATATAAAVDHADSPRTEPSGNYTAEQAAPALEKRRSPRYKCEASVQITEEGRNLRTWATCTDISMHGCYVEAAVTKPAGTVLKLKIETKDIRIEARGVVRVAYSQLGMGIAFTEMEQQERARLRELLRVLSTPSVVMGQPETVTNQSTRPEPLPEVPDPKAALSAMLKFFENRQMLTRSEFILLVRRSQMSGEDGR